MERVSGSLNHSLIGRWAYSRRKQKKKYFYYKHNQEGKSGAKIDSNNTLFTLRRKEYAKHIKHPSCIKVIEVDKKSDKCYGVLTQLKTTGAPGPTQHKQK